MRRAMIDAVGLNVFSAVSSGVVAASGKEETELAPVVKILAVAVAHTMRFADLQTEADSDWVREALSNEIDVAYTRLRREVR